MSHLTILGNVEGLTVKQLILFANRGANLTSILDIQSALERSNHYAELSLSSCLLNITLRFFGLFSA